MIILCFGAFHIHQTSLEYDLLYKCPCELHLHCFQGVLLHVRYITILNIVLLYHLCMFLPPANVGWSMNDGRISAIGRRRLEYELWKILTVGQSINYVSHCYPLAGSVSHRPSNLLMHI